MSNPTTATAARNRARRAAPTIRCHAQVDPAKDALDDALRSALGGREYKAVRPLIRTGFFKGTVAQHAAAAGLSLQQCERARRALKARGVIVVHYNSKSANRGPHNSTVVLNGDWDAAQRKRGLISAKSRKNNGIQDLTVRSEGAIYTDIYDASSSIDIGVENHPPSEQTVAFSPQTKQERQDRPEQDIPRGPSAIEGVAKAAGDASAGLALTPLRAAAPAVAAEPAPPEGAGRHPDWMKVRTRSWALVGDLAADLWQEKTGVQWTRREHKMFKDAYHGKTVYHEQGDLPALLAWAFDNWDDIVMAEFAFMTRNRPPSIPTPTFMCAADNANKILWLYEVELVDPGHLLRAAQSERKSTEWRERRDAKEDRRSKYGDDDAEVVEAIMFCEEVTWTEATVEADRIAPLYCGQPHARIAATMFINHFGYDDPGERASDFMRRILPLARALAEYEGDRGEHPTLDLATSIWLGGEANSPQEALRLAKEEALWLAKEEALRLANRLAKEEALRLAKEESE